MTLFDEDDDLPTALSAGECQVCGCTDERACPGGCIWANAEATLCSRCARREIGPELGPSEDEEEAD